jgi:hydroxymethylpyrimidine/phosphomethylpyrimidine kinase
MKRALTIAGSDSGGAQEFRQISRPLPPLEFRHIRYNSAYCPEYNRVQGISEVDPKFVMQQIKSVLDDIRR